MDCYVLMMYCELVRVLSSICFPCLFISSIPIPIITVIGLMKAPHHRESFHLRFFCSATFRFLCSIALLHVHISFILNAFGFAIVFCLAICVCIVCSNYISSQRSLHTDHYSNAFSGSFQLDQENISFEHTRHTNTRATSILHFCCW